MRQASGGSGAGGSGNAPEVGVWTESLAADDSAECRAYKTNSDISASNGLVNELRAR